MKTTIEIKPAEEGYCLTVQKENGDTVNFRKPEEASEFLEIWFNLTKLEIKDYFDGKSYRMGIE